MSERPPIAEYLCTRLSVHLGPNVARMAVKTFAMKSVNKKPEELTVPDLPQLIAAIRPMLTVMIGKEPSEVVIKDVSREYRLAG